MSKSGGLGQMLFGFLLLALACACPLFMCAKDVWPELSLSEVGASIFSGLLFVKNAGTGGNVADPAYAIYKKYRYAYEMYGYLFLSSGTDVGKRTEGGTVSGMIPAGNAAVPLPEITLPGSPDGDWFGAGTNGGPATLPTLAQLQDYDFLMKHYYSVHTSTTAGRDLMRVETFLGMNLRLEKNADVPQILIYHTHSQETYADYGPGNTQANVVSVGDDLARLLRERGWNVIHDTSVYDMRDGELDRNRAYNYALEGITEILRENPTVEVILDLHRDGVADNVRLVSEIDGKETANIMFFQGMCRTPEGEISYLPNPYLEQNLAFSFQMQLLASGRYPGYARKIYLKGLRYNMHLRPRSALIEVGAQTNTLQEARNAMEPLAELLDTVLRED
ncbi:MAG: stage II sporulation protein P [Clostridiales bacterium]|nr:stage II sporulation protein P [Clostridiales bacterium]